MNFFTSLPVELFFTLGLLLKAGSEILIRVKDKYLGEKLFGYTFLSALVTLRIVGESVWFESASLVEVLMLFSFICTIVYIFVFRKYFLPEINELMLLIWTISVVYLHFKYLGFESPLTLVVTIPTLFTLAIVFFRFKLNFLTEVLLYVWFMIMSIIVSLTLIPWSEIFETSFQFTGTRLEMFFFGMTLFYTLSYIFYIFYFFPPINKKDPFGEWKEHLLSHMKLMSKKFHDTQFHPLTSLLLIVSLVTIFVLNSRYQIMTDVLLFALLFSFSPWLGRKHDEWIVKKLKKVNV